MAPIYYTINSSTPIVSGITTLTLEENLINTVGVNISSLLSTSKIVASSHTFEYIGSGNTITEATQNAVALRYSQMRQKTNGGNMVYQHRSIRKFRIGDDLQINQNTGTISVRAFSRSLFTEMTPFILTLVNMAQLAYQNSDSHT